MQLPPDKPSAVRSILSILAKIGTAILIVGIAVVTAVMLLFASFLVVIMFQAHHPGPIPSALEFCGYALIPLSVVGGLAAGVATTETSAAQFTRRRIGLACLFVIAAAFAMRHFDRSHTWASIQYSTNLQESAEVSELSIYNDPSLIHPYWTFAHFKIPRERVGAFVKANECEATDQTSLHHPRQSIPDEFQALPTSGKRFLKKGRTRADLGFDLLVDESGTVLLFVTSPD
jgi:hypothetical protein